MRDWVAVILAVTIALTLVPGAVVPAFVGREQPVTPEEVQLWRDILMVLIGALAGYVGGKPQP